MYQSDWISEDYGCGEIKVKTLKSFRLPNIHTESPSFRKRQRRTLSSEPLDRDKFDDPEVPQSTIVD